MLIESELDTDFERFSNRARFKTNDIYKLYVEICKLKGSEPSFLFNGSELLSMEKYQELKAEDKTDNKKLRELFKVSS